MNAYKVVKAAVIVKRKKPTVLSTGSAKNAENSVEIFTLLISLSKSPETAKIKHFVTLVKHFQLLKGN